MFFSHIPISLALVLGSIMAGAAADCTDTGGVKVAEGGTTCLNGDRIVTCQGGEFSKANDPMTKGTTKCQPENDCEWLNETSRTPFCNLTKSRRRSIRHTVKKERNLEGEISPEGQSSQEGESSQGGEESSQEGEAN